MRADTTTPPVQCPKCGADRGSEASACPACGLAVARMAAYAETRDAAVPEVLHRAWTHAIEQWADAPAHDELLRLVVANNCYAWAAGRYRTREPDPTAQRQLERLRRAAVVSLLATATTRPDVASKPYRSATGVLAVLIVMIAAGLLYAMVVRDRPPRSQVQRLPAAVPAGAPGGVRPLSPGHPVSSSTVK